MKIQYVFCCWISSFAFCATARGTLPEYELVVLPPFNSDFGRPSGQAFSVNEVGQVVGTAIRYDGMDWVGDRAARWPLPDVSENLGTISTSSSGYSISQSTSININGDSVGWAYAHTSGISGLPGQAMYWHSGDISPSRFLLPTEFRTVVSSGAYGLNDSGVAVGTARPVVGQTSALRWDSFTSSPTMLGDTVDEGITIESRIALAINNLGMSVGAGNWSEGSFNTSRAMAWDADANGLLLKKVPFASAENADSTARAISESGVIVGSGFKFSAEGDFLSRHALRWASVESEPELLGFFDDFSSVGGVANYAYGVNDNMITVGHASLREDDGTFHYRAVLWDETGNAHALDDLVVNLKGRELLWARDIGDNGHVVGLVRSPDGTEQPFLLNPIPEPASTVLAVNMILTMFLMWNERQQSSQRC